MISTASHADPKHPDEKGPTLCDSSTATHPITI